MFLFFLKGVGGLGGGGGAETAVVAGFFFFLIGCHFGRGGVAVGITSFLTLFSWGWGGGGG